MSPEILPSRRHDADRHERVIERRVRFTDRHVGDAVFFEPLRFVRECSLVGHGEHDCVRVAGQIPGTTLPRCVDNLGGHQPDGEVRAHDYVVTEGVFGDQRLAEITVVGRS